MRRCRRWGRIEFGLGFSQMRGGSKGLGESGLRAAFSFVGGRFPSRRNCALRPSLPSWSRSDRSLSRLRERAGVRAGVSGGHVTKGPRDGTGGPLRRLRHKSGRLPALCRSFIPQRAGCCETRKSPIPSALRGNPPSMGCAFILEWLKRCTLRTGTGHGGCGECLRDKNNEVRDNVRRAVDITLGLRGWRASSSLVSRRFWRWC